MDIIKPRQLAQQQPIAVVKPEPLNNIDEIMDVIAKPIQIFIPFKRNDQNQGQSVPIDQISQQIQEFTEEGTQNLINNELQEGILKLRKSESLIDQCFKNDHFLEKDLIVHSLVNLGICYYRIGLLEQSLICLENCMVLLRQNPQKKKREKQILSTSQFYENMVRKIKYRTFKCRIHTQCCIILSEMLKHDQALAHSNYAIHKAFKILKDAIAICYYTLICQKYPDQENDINLNTIHELKGQGEFDPKTVQKLGILLEISNTVRTMSFNQSNTEGDFIISVLARGNSFMVACGPIDFPKLDMNDLFQHVTPKSNNLKKQTILQFLVMNFMVPSDFNEVSDLENEIDADSLLYKISNLASCFYCASTESRFLEEKNMMHLYSPNIILESEFMLTKAVGISYQYLRSDIPFVMQIIRVYQKFHSTDQQSIQELEEYDRKFEPQSRNLFLKQTFGLPKVENFIPIVRMPIISKTFQIEQQSISEKPITGQNNRQGQARQESEFSDKFKLTQMNNKTTSKTKFQKLEKIYMQPKKNKNKSFVSQYPEEEKPQSADSMKHEQQNIKNEQIKIDQIIAKKTESLVQLAKIYQNSIIQRKPLKMKSDVTQLPQLTTSPFKQQINVNKSQNQNIIINNNINILITDKNWESGNQIVQDVIKNLNNGSQEKRKNNIQVKKI